MAAHSGMVASVVELRCIAAVLQVASGAGWFAKNPHPSYSCKSPSIWRLTGFNALAWNDFLNTHQIKECRNRWRVVFRTGANVLRGENQTVYNFVY
jgi:hypothetical protein